MRAATSRSSGGEAKRPSTGRALGQRATIERCNAISAGVRSSTYVSSLSGCQATLSRIPASPSRLSTNAYHGVQFARLQRPGRA